MLLDVRDFDEIASGVIEGALVMHLEVDLKNWSRRSLWITTPTSCCTANPENDRHWPRARLVPWGSSMSARSREASKPGAKTGHPVLTGTMELASPVQGGGSQSTSAVVLSDWDSIRSDYPITTARIECTDGLSRPLIYLDHAATTHPPATALQAYLQFLGLEYSNVHRATHSLARSATDRFEKAYETCAEFIGGTLDDGCVVFTANTTHACDLVAHVVAHLPGKVVVTDLEHHSNDLPHRGTQ